MDRKEYTSPTIASVGPVAQGLTVTVSIAAVVVVAAASFAVVAAAVVITMPV